jgi:hypothetical protein
MVNIYTVSSIIFYIYLPIASRLTSDSSIFSSKLGTFTTDKERYEYSYEFANDR